MQHIYRSNGNYLGFISDKYIFSWDGNYLGWIDNQNFVWRKNGNFAGKLQEISGVNYILRNTLQIIPISKSPRTLPLTPAPPTPKVKIAPVQTPIGWEDSF